MRLALIYPLSVNPWLAEAAAMIHQRQTLPNGWTLVLVDSITQLDASDDGCVVVTGSHGGASSTAFALQHRPRLACFNDAGVGKDQAGILALQRFEDQGLPCVTVSHESARIGDALDAWAHGVISHVNRSAAQRGLHTGMRLQEALRAL